MISDERIEADIEDALDEHEVWKALVAALPAIIEDALDEHEREEAPEDEA